MTMAIDQRANARVAFWNNPRVRSFLIQATLVVVIGLLAWQIVDNTLTNLRTRNIASGWDFLGKTAGFDIIQRLIPYTNTSTYGRALVVGFLNTVLVAVLGIIAATLIGFVVGVMRLSRNWVVRQIATVYVEVVRNIPLLLQIFVWYALVLKPLPPPAQSVSVFESFFLSNRGLVSPMPIFGDGFWVTVAAFIMALAGAFALHKWARARQARTGEQFPSILAGLGLIAGLPILAFLLSGMPVTFEYPRLDGFNFTGGLLVIPEFMALLTALSIYTAAFIAEIVRAGILAVSHGQTEASLALGLTRGQTLRQVVIPQALRTIIPPLTSQYLNLTKNSSLAVAIAYPDLVAAGQIVLNQSGQSLEVVFVWMVVYLTLSLLTSLIMNWYNARVRLVER